MKHYCTSGKFLQLRHSGKSICQILPLFKCLALWIFVQIYPMERTMFALNIFTGVVFSLCNHVNLYGLTSLRLFHSPIDHIKTSHSFKHGYNNGRWVVLYALVSPQWPHAWFFGRVRTILFHATKLCPCVNMLGGTMYSVWLWNSLGRASAYSGHVDYTGWVFMYVN